MLAFRVIQDAIAAAGPAVAVGGKIQMATVRLGEGDRPETQLYVWDDPEIKDAVDNWGAAEATRFREHVPAGEIPVDAGTP